MVSISNISLHYPSEVSDRLDKINSQLKDIPAILDKETIQKFQNGEYEITLEEYTDLNTYRTTMGALYGNSSADKFNSALEGYLGISSNNISAKEFIQGLEQKGVSSSSALKLYTSLRSYTSLLSSLGQKNSFVSAKI